jgi:DNA primase
MPRISEETIRRVADATDIVELVGSYFPLKRAGSAWKALCPFHNEKTPSFQVTPARQSFHCFGCGAGGGVFRFVMDYEHIPFTEAVRRLASKSGIPVIEEAGGSHDDRAHEIRRRLLAIHARTSEWFHDSLMKSPEADAARQYLKSRGISSPVAKSWQIGFAPDSWDALTDFLKAQKFTNQEIVQSGLVSSKEDSDNSSGRFYARFRGRVMFPIRNDFGEVIAFSGRVLEAEARTAKYVNSPETPLFNKGRVLYGLDKSKRALIDAKEAIVCEGQLDTISAFEAGVKNVIAPQGTAFTHDQARLLSRFVESVVLCFDSDKAGQEATSRSLPALLECGLTVKVARLPAGSDPDSLIRSEGPEAFRAATASAKDFFDHAIDRTIEAGVLSDPAKTAAATRKLGGFVELISDPVTRDLVIGKICSRFGVNHDAFKAQLRRSKPKSFERQNSPEEMDMEPPLPLSEGMKVLCRHALMDPASRTWLAENGALRAGEIEEGGLLLQHIVATGTKLEEPGQLGVFVASLPSKLERALASLDTGRTQDDLLQTTREWWLALAEPSIRSKLQAAILRLRSENSDSSSQHALREEIQSLTDQLKALVK